MRSRASATWPVVALACCVGSIASFAVPLAAVAAPDETEISNALERVHADPNISPERKMSTLKWVDEDDPEQRKDPGWFKWIGGLFAWIGSASLLITNLTGHPFRPYCFLNEIICISLISFPHPYSMSALINPSRLKGSESSSLSL